MKINVTIKAELDLTLNVTDSVLDEVVRLYNGDFRSWAESNYTEYFDIDDLETECESVYFDKDEAKELLETAREKIGSSDDDLTRVAIERTKLEQSIAHMPPVGECKEIEVDIELLAKALPYTDIHNPRVEINYIYLNGTNVYATDTRRLIKLYDHKYYFENILFPTYFIEPMQNGAKCFFDEENNLFLEYNNTIYRGVNKKQLIYGKINYPDAERILMDDINKFDHMDYKDITPKVCTEDDTKLFVEVCIVKDVPIYINKMYWDEAIKHDIKTVATNSSVETTRPLFLLGDGFQIVLMPIVIDKKERAKLAYKDN